MIRLPESGSVLGWCGCGALVREDSFRNECSLAEWHLSGFCQRCQDKFFLAVDQEGDAQVYPFRFGALAAHRSSACEVLEIGLIPFLCIPSQHVLAWEARYALRIGRVIPPARPTELDPMAEVLAKHHVRATSIYEFLDPGLAEWFSDLELLVALDCRSLGEIVDACPVLRGGLGVSVADGIPWTMSAGRPRSALGPFVRAGRLDSGNNGDWPPPSALRLCARMGAALSLEDESPSGDKRTALWHLLESI